MPNEEKIDSFFEIPALQKEHATLLSMIEKLQSSLDRLSKTEINLSGATRGKDIVAGIKEAESATAQYTQSTKAAVNEFNSLLLLTKQNTVDLRARNLELSASQKQLTLDITRAKEETRLKAIAEKDAAAAAKLASKQAQEDGTQRILQLKAEQAERDKIEVQEIQRNQAEEARLASGNFSNTSTGNKAKPSGETFIPSGELQRQIQDLQLAEKALAANQAAQKQLKKELQAGEITQADYNRELTKAIQLEAEYKRTVSLTGASIKNATREQEAIKGSLEQRRAALIRLNKEYDNLGPIERNAASGQRLQRVIGGLTTQVQTLEVETGRAQRNVGNYGNAITGAFGKVFSGLQKIAYLVPGLGIAGLLGLLIDPITNFIGKLLESKTALKDTQDVLEESKSTYAGAAAEVNKLKVDIQLAKDGFLDKNKVVKEYNDTIGKTTGQVQTLDQAEQALIKNADAYIRFTFLKAAATTAQAKAGKEAVDAELENQKDLEKISKINTPGAGKSDKAAGADGLSEFLAKGVDNERKATEKSNKKRIDQLNNIGAKFEKEAAELAKKFNFDFFGGADEGAKTEKDSTKIKAITKKFFDDELKDQAEALKAISKDQDLHFTDRLNKRKESYDIENSLIKKQRDIELQNEREKLKAIIEAETSKGDKGSKNAIINAENEYTQNVIEINQKRGYQLKKLETELGGDLLKIHNEAAKKNLDEARKDNEEAMKFFDEQDKARVEAVKKEIDGNEARLNQRSNFLASGRDIELKILEDRKNKGLVTQEEYEKAKLKIENDYNKLLLLAQLDYAEQYLAIQKASGQDTSAAEAKLAALRLAIAKKSNADVLDEQSELLNDLDKFQGYFSQISSILGDAMNVGFTKQKNDLQDLIDLGEKKKLADIDAVNATTASEQDKAAKISIINARAAAQKEALELKQRQIDQQKARFEKASQIAAITIAGIKATVAALGSVPYTPYNIALAAFTGALAAAQLAVAIATPIPKYRHGTTDHPGGPAEVGDGGKRELVINPDGSGFITPDKATVIDLQKHAKVFPDAERLVKARHYASFKAMPVIPGATVQTFDSLERTMKKGLTEVKTAIQGKPTAVIRNSLSGWKIGYDAEQRHVEWVNRLMM